MSIGPSPLCMFCKHHDRRPGRAWTCSAFPERIPKEIIEREVEHTSPYPGDHGIQFELAEDRRENYEFHITYMKFIAQKHEDLLRRGIISE